ncbi:neutral zinc metallopeptidase [Mariniluteicoccus endophyticus]
MTQNWGNQWPAPGAGGQQPGWGGQQPGWGGQQPGFGQGNFGQQYGQQQWGAPQQGWHRPGPAPQQPYAGQHPGAYSPQGSAYAPGQPAYPTARRGGPAKAILITLGVVLAAFAALALISALSQPSYKNDDYRVPPADPSAGMVDIPATSAEAKQTLEKNAAYNVKVASPVRCEMPEIDARTASDAQIKAYFDQQMACLMRVWDPALSQTKKYTIHRPTVTVYGDSVSSPCGQIKGVNAVFCAANQQLYYSRDMARTDELKPLQRPRGVELVMAHEFGHLIQGRIGVVGSRVRIMESENPSTEEALWMSRRSEVQADCLSGMYVRAVRQSRGYTDADIQTFFDALHAIGDDSLGAPAGKGNHGSAASRRYWGQLGMSTDEVGKCNTWIVPKEQVR